MCTIREHTCTQNTHTHTLANHVTSILTSFCPVTWGDSILFRCKTPNVGRHKSCTAGIGAQRPSSGADRRHKVLHDVGQTVHRLLLHTCVNCSTLLLLLPLLLLVSWSLTSLFSTNMAISQTKGQGWRVILTQWRKASDILTSTLAAFLFSSHPKKGKGSRGSFKLLR